MKNLIKYKPGEDSWIRWIKKRIAHNLNFISLFQGSPGIGKTWSALSVAQMIDPNFNINQVVFSFKELMSVVNSKEFKQKKPYKIIIFDEPQCEISNRNWQSLSNKLMNYLLTTFRHQNIILIFASPYADFLDSQSMKLLHCIFSCEGINKKNSLSRVRPKIQQYNSYMRKTYQHPLQVIRGKKVIPLRDWYIPKPSKDLIDKYEAKKEAFTSGLNRDIMLKLNELSEKDKPKDEQEQSLEDKRRSEVCGYPLRGRKPMTDNQLKAMKTLAHNNYDESVKILGITRGAICQSKKLAEKKGYSLAEFRSNEE